MKKTTRLMSLIIAAALILSGCNQNNVVSHGIPDTNGSETTTTTIAITTSVTTTEATTTTSAAAPETEDTTPATTVSIEETTVPEDAVTDATEDTTVPAETTEITTEQAPVETTTVATTAVTTASTTRATTTSTVILAYTSASVAGNPEPPHIYVIHVDKYGNEEYDWNSAWNDMSAGVFTQTIYAKELDQALENAFTYWEKTYGTTYGKAVAKVIYYTGETIIYSREGGTPATTTSATTTVKPETTAVITSTTTARTTAKTTTATTVKTTTKTTETTPSSTTVVTTTGAETTTTPSDVSFIDDYKRRYMYSQLTNTQKKWYDYIFNKVRYGSSAKKPSISSEDHSVAQTAYEDSSPHTALYNLSIEDRKKIETIANKIITKALKESTSYNQLKIIHDELCNITDYGGNQSWTNLFLNGKGNCWAYSDAFTYLCQLAGYDCLRVGGDVYNGTNWGGHEWNMVKVEGKWYYVDVTWDDGGWGTKWFLKGSDTMSKDHKVSTTIAVASIYPTASKTDYKA